MFLGTTCDELHGPDVMEKLSRIRSICEEKEKKVSNVKKQRKSKKGQAPKKLVLDYDEDCGRGIENQDPAQLRYHQTDPRYCIAKLRPGGVCPPDTNPKLYPLVCPCIRYNGRQDFEDDYNKFKCIKNFPWYKNGGKQAEKIICYREIEEEKKKHEREMMCQIYCEEKYKREKEARCEEHRNRELQARCEEHRNRELQARCEEHRNRENQARCEEHRNRELQARCEEHRNRENQARYEEHRNRELQARCEEHRNRGQEEFNARCCVCCKCIKCCNGL